MSLKAVVLIQLISAVLLERLPEIIQSVQGDFKTILFLYSGEFSTEMQEILVMESTLPMLKINLMDCNYSFYRGGKTQLQYPKPSRKFQILNNNTIPIMKFYSETDFFVIIDLVVKLEKTQLLTIEKLLTFKKDVRIVIIANETTNLLSSFHKLKFSKVVLLPLNDLKSYKTFENFPSFRIKRRSSINIVFENAMKNIQNFPVRVGFINGNIRAMLYRNEDMSIEYAGYLNRFLQAFVEYINGTITYRNVSDLNHALSLLSSDEIDFITETIPFTHTEAISDVIFIIHWGIMMPVPKEIVEELYVVRPFTLGVWISYVVLTFYLAMAINLVLRVKTNANDFWKSFDISTRGILSQATQYTDKVRLVSPLYMIVMLVGFVTTTLYSSFLGSYLTTTIYEQPINSWKQVVESPYKVALIDWEFKNLLSYIPNRDLFEPLPLHEFLRRTYELTNNSCGYALSSDVWEFFVNPKQNHYNMNKFLWTKTGLAEYPFIINLQENSFYKENVNKFLNLVADHGLMKHWMQSSFLEIRRASNDIFKYTADKDDIEVLTLIYFKYPLSFIVAGLALGFLAFIWEVFRGGKCRK